MIEFLRDLSTIGVNFLIIFIFSFSTYKIYNLLNKSRSIINKMEEFIPEIDVINNDVDNDDIEEKRNRLATLAAGGMTKTYLGKDLPIDKIEKMTNDEIRSAYAKYESRLGGVMTKTLGKSLLTLYTHTVGTVLPISEENKSKMTEELELDPFIAHAISGFTCKLYHNFGAFLAPLTAAMTTVKYCEFKKKSDNNLPVLLEEGEFENDA